MVKPWPSTPIPRDCGPARLAAIRILEGDVAYRAGAGGDACPYPVNGVRQYEARAWFYGRGLELRTTEGLDAATFGADDDTTAIPVGPAATP